MDNTSYYNASSSFDAPPSIISTFPNDDLSTKQEFNRKLIDSLMKVFNRKKNKNLLPKEVRKKKEVKRKLKQRMSNTSRKINQAKARRNKFQRKK